MARNPEVTDVAFEDAGSVHDIQYRLHPIDVGFDLRTLQMVVAIDAGADPLRVSYPDHDGNSRVMEGPQQEVLRRLRKLGFRFEVQRGSTTR